MFAYNFIDIAFAFYAVPYIIGVDYYTWAKLATVKAPGIIHPCFFDTQRFDAGFHIVAQGLRAFFRAGTAFVPRIAPVGAAENMVRVITHSPPIIAKDSMDQHILKEGYK